MFGKRFNIFTVAGIKIGLDASWFFIALLMTWTLASTYFPFYYKELSPSLYWPMGLAGMLGLFVSILLHELGHAFVAKYFKLPISQITLFLFGGVAELKKEPQSPKVEFLVAIAGPLVSFFLAYAFYFFTSLGESLKWPLPLTAVTDYLASINMMIAVFNLIPAFPLDGGRIFRAFLWWWNKNLVKATKIAGLVGSLFGIFLIILGLFSFFTGNLLAGLWLVIIGLFLRSAASSSESSTYIGQELKGETVKRFMKRDLITVSPTLTVKEFIDRYVYQSHHHLYPVTEGDTLLGTVSLIEVKALEHEKWSSTQIKSILVPFSRLQTVTPETSALEALNIMQETAHTTLLVTTGQKLVGLLTAQDLFKLIALKFELEEK